MTWKSIPPLTGMAWLLTHFILAATASYGPGLSTVILATARAHLGEPKYSLFPK